MSHPIRWRRLVAYVSSFLLLFVLLYAAGQGCAAAQIRRLVQEEMMQLQSSAPTMVSNAEAWLRVLTTIDQAGASMPSADADSSHTIDEEQWITRYVANQIKTMSAEVRAEWTVATTTTWEHHLTYARTLQNTPIQISGSWLAVIVEAVVFPIRNFSKHRITVGGSTSAYPAPSSIWPTLYQSTVGPWAGFTYSPWSTILEAAGWCISMLIGFAIMPASLVLLPVSRRRAKVRWSHIVRATSYCAFIPVTVLMLATFMFASAVIFRSWTDTLFFWMLWMIRLLPSAMLVCWWGAVISRYLRIPHGHFTAFVLWVLCMLVFLAAVYVFAPEFLINV
jgi:hypothetical protein